MYNDIYIYIIVFYVDMLYFSVTDDHILISCQIKLISISISVIQCHLFLIEINPIFLVLNQVTADSESSSAAKC